MEKIKEKDIKLTSLENNFNSLSIKLKQLIQFHDQQVNNLSMEVDNTFKQNETLQNQIKSHQETNEILQQKINNISEEFNQLQSDYDNQHITLESLQSKIQSYSEYKKDAEEKITALETTFNEQKKEIERLNNELITKKDEINKLNQQICGEVKQTQKLLKRSETTMKSELDRQKETQKAMDLLSPSSSFSPATRADARKSFGSNNEFDESIEQLGEIAKQIDGIVRQSQDIVNEYIFFLFIYQIVFQE